MENEALVRQIVVQVIKQLEQESKSPSTGEPRGKILAVVTGGYLGASDSFSAIRKLIEEGFAVDVVLSHAASSVHPRDALQGQLRGARIRLEGEVEHPYSLVQQYDLVIVAILTKFTAAKTALLLTDTFPVATVIDALWLGKPVIAASDSAELEGAPVPLERAARCNLDRLAELGVKLVRARNLADAAIQHLAGDHLANARFSDSTKAVRTDDKRDAPIPEESSVRAIGLPQLGKERVIAREKTSSRRLITTLEIREALTGSGRIPVKGALVTPLARELARDLGVELVDEEEKCA
jgi:phosphopantothenoylcysteine synthetase/decarboxylase